MRTQNWTNDANNNLPISATKFDNEDNDFAGGLSLCLTRDNQGKPTAPLTWSQPLTINLASDGTPGAFGRTGGTNNPQLQLELADATGATINLSTAQTLALAIAGTNALTLSGTGASIAIGAHTALSINSAGALTIPAPTAGVALAINGFAGSAPLQVFPASTTDIGITIQGAALGAAIMQYAPNAAASGDICYAGAQIGGQYVLDGATGDFFIRGQNSIRFSTNGGTSSALVINSAGAATINTPSAGGDALTVKGTSTASTFAAALLGVAGGGGLYVAGGATTSDICAQFQNAAQSANYAYIQGNGEFYLTTPPAASSPPTGMFQVGYMETVINSQSSPYTLAITDRGKFISQSGASVTIPANASVAFPIGTTLMVYANVGSGSIAINITTDTLQWLPSGSSGNRTLASRSLCTLYKVSAALWFIWGFGLS